MTSISSMETDSNFIDTGDLGRRGGGGLCPVSVAERTLSGWDMAGLWIALVTNVPNYYLAGSLVDLGMSWWQGIATIFLGNLVIVAPICLTAHAGVRYGVHFSVQLRAAFGVRGAFVPALLRAVVACGWCGIESWIGGQSIFLLLLPRSAASSPLAQPLSWLGTSPLELGCFLLFSVLQLAVVWKGMGAINALSRFSAPILILLVATLFAWAYAAAGSFGDMLSTPSRLSPSQFWPVFFSSLTGCVGTWASLALNISDFARFACSQADQVFGQMGLPIFQTAFTFAGLAITSATVVIFGRTISNPIELLSTINSNFFVSAIAFFGIALATITTNIPANFVAPVTMLLSLCPSAFSFATGSLLTAAISFAFQPWKLMGSSDSFVYTWLVGYSAVLGPITGIMLTDYYVLRRARLDVSGLYSDNEHGPYYYTGGYNVVAFVALAAGVAPAVPGFLHKVGAVGVTWEMFDVVYGSAWFFGVSIASLVYWALSRCCGWAGRRQRHREASSTRTEPLLCTAKSLGSSDVRKFPKITSQR
ncbi:purine-uracil permease NCS1-like [Zingiber officinale]|uniref:purine-uracil permease NCS1-like n=1 Tax=Zingiber officinale TaxID=94328 RepID=UPI001C4CC403|nr:purine-uracil permease NCS1-like [Zingiber officinale]